MYKSKTECLNDFFSLLNNKGIPYSVVGDTRELPDKVKGDIDIVVNKTDLANINQTIEEFSAKSDCDLVQVLQHESTASYFVLSFFDVNGRAEYIHPDICSDYYRNGKSFITADEILKGRKLAKTEEGEDKDFYVCASEVEFIYYLIKKIDKDSLNKQQFQHLLEQYEKASDECKNKLINYWQPKEVNYITQAMDNADFDMLNNQLSHLKKELAANTKINFKDFLYEFKRKLSRVLHPTGLVLVFLGPDGAGKTAVGERLEEELTPAFRNVKRYHLRPNLFGKKGKAPVVVTDPHGSPARNMFSSIAKIMYFICDFFIGFVSEIWPLKIKSHLIIFDRYYHDLLIDPIRYRYGAPMCLAKVGSWFIPKPDLYIVLDAPAEVIQARKQEVTFAETQRQRTSYLNFASEQSNCIVLDTSVGIDETVKMGTEKILKFMKNRQLNRMHNK